MAGLVIFGVGLMLAAGDVSPSLPPLPAAGWVEVGALVKGSPQWRRVADLRRQAAALRASADSVAPAVLPTVPPERLPVPPTAQPVSGGFETKAAQLELQLLREAALSEMAAERRRQLAAQSGRLRREVLARLIASQEDWLRWEDSLGADQQMARTTLALEAHRDGGKLPAEAQVDLNLLDGVSSAVAATRRREQQGTLARYARQRLTEATSALDAHTAEQLRAADLALAQRAKEQSADLAALRQARAELAGPSAAQPQGLDLAPWKATLAEQGQALDADHAADREALAAAAAGLEAAADELAKRLAERLPQDIALGLKMVEDDAGVRLYTEPRDQEGRPDVTAAVAAHLAALHLEDW
jgi:hypothetical protein